ncbi:MAG: TIGR02301 family protein [Candidatus Phaeomarinobacter sp.]
MAATVPASAGHADPALDAGLSRLAGTLGAVHYLRTLCKPNEGQLWRNKMLDLLSSGDIDQSERNALIGAFNAGYARQQTAHSRCTPAAANLGNTYVRQGAQQARQLAQQLSN